MKRVLVAGATGYLGRYIVKALKEHGYWVRALARSPESLDMPGHHAAPSVRSYADEVVQGEVTRPHTLKGICGGMDYVVSTIGITRQKDGVSFVDVDYQGNMNLLQEAESGGVEKFLFIAVYKGDEIGGILNDCKERFVNRLKQSAVRHVIVRPTGYYSDMEEYLRMAVKGRVFLFGRGTKKMNPIHGADLADFCVEGLSADNVELNVGGPQVLTHREIARLAFQAAGRPEQLMRIPLWIFKSAISPMRIVSPNSYGALQFFYHVMTHDLAAPCYGQRDLLSYFRERVRENKLN